MSTIAIAVIGLIVMIVLLLLGMNIGFSMMLVGIVGYTILTNFDAAMGMLRQIPASQASSYTLCVIPLFTLMGNLAFYAGISDGLFNAGDKWLSKLPGGLACAAIVACAAFGAICGSAPATAATMSVVAIPAMRKMGYADSLACGCVSVGGTLGVMIPPSTPLIVYAIMAEESIGQLFSAGVLPGILTALICCIFIIVMCVVKKDLAPSTTRKITWGERFASLKGVVWVVVLFVIVLGGLFSGIFTVNEAAACGSVAALIIMIIVGNFTWKNFFEALKGTVTATAMIYIILIGATVFGKFLTISMLPAQIATFVGGLAISRYIIIFIIVLIYLVMGCFIDALPMITLTVPIFLPVVLDLGFDVIWFGILIILVMQMGYITPPVGMCSYVVSGCVKDVPLMTVFRGVWPFVPALFIAVIFIVFIPQIATWLPSLLF